MILAGITSVYQLGGAKRKHQWDEHATNKFRINPRGPTSVSMKPLPDYKPTGYNIKRGVERPINYDDLFRNKNVNQQIAQKFPQYVSNPGMGSMNITTLPYSGSMPSIPPVDTRPIKQDSENVFFDAEEYDFGEVKEEEVKEEKGIFQKALNFISETFFETESKFKDEKQNNDESFTQSVKDEYEDLLDERKKDLQDLVLMLASKITTKKTNYKLSTEEEKILQQENLSKILDEIHDNTVHEKSKEKGFSKSAIEEYKKLNESRKKDLQDLVLMIASKSIKEQKIIKSEIEKEKLKKDDEIKKFMEESKALKENNATKPKTKDSLGGLKDPSFGPKSNMPAVVAKTNETTTGADINFKNTTSNAFVVGSTNTNLPNVVASKNKTSTDSTLSPISEETIDLGSGTENPKNYNLNNLNDLQEIADRFPEAITHYLNEQIAFKNAKKFSEGQAQKNNDYLLKKEIAANKATKASFLNTSRKLVKKSPGILKLEAVNTDGDPTSTESLSPAERIISSKRRIKIPPKKPTFYNNTPKPGATDDFRSDQQKELDYIYASLTSPDSTGSDYVEKGKGKAKNKKGKGKKK